MAIKFTVSPKEGFRSIITPGNSDLTYLNISMIQSGSLKNWQGKTSHEETVFVLTRGNLRFMASGKLLGKLIRKNVFESPPIAVYLPPDTEYSMEFDENSEICQISCKSEKQGIPILITSKDLKVEKRGADTYYRTVTDIINEHFPADKLVVGETINDPGNWSSYPPHKHDRNRPPEEIAMEEVYFFKIVPETGFGIMRIFDDQEDNLFLLKNNDMITIPKGYHPLTVAPQHQIYYLWALAGKQRALKPYTHPEYRF